MNIFIRGRSLMHVALGLLGLNGGCGSGTDGPDFCKGTTAAGVVSAEVIVPSSGCLVVINGDNQNSLQFAFPASSAGSRVNLANEGAAIGWTEGAFLQVVRVEADTTFPAEVTVQPSSGTPFVIALPTTGVKGAGKALAADVGTRALKVNHAALPKPAYLAVASPATFSSSWGVSSFSRGCGSDPTLHAASYFTIPGRTQTCESARLDCCIPFDVLQRSIEANTMPCALSNLRNPPSFSKEAIQQDWCK